MTLSHADGISKVPGSFSEKLDVAFPIGPGTTNFVQVAGPQGKLVFPLEPVGYLVDDWDLVLDKNSVGIQVAVEPLDKGCGLLVLGHVVP